MLNEINNNLQDNISKEAFAQNSKLKEEKINVVLIGVYQYYNASIRLLRPLIGNIEGVNAYSIFYKKYIGNIYNAPTSKEEELFVNLIKKINPKVVGLSLLSPYVEICKRLTVLIKENTDALVLWGGVGPTLEPELHIKPEVNGGADMICVGEGEVAISQFIEAVRDGTDYKKIRNLWIREGDKIIKNPMGSMIQDLDTLPFAEWGHKNMFFIEHNRVIKDDPELENGIFYIQTSRGCPYSCNFCVESTYHEIYDGLGKRVRRRSVGNILKELKTQLAKPGNRKKRVDFVDEVFGSNKPWIDEFAPRYKKEIGLPFYAKYHPKTLKPAIIERMVEAGIAYINFGLQTGSDYIRNVVYERPGTKAEALFLCWDLKKHKVDVVCDLILDNDFETKDTLKECIEFITKLPKPRCFNISSLKHFPGYGLTKKAIAAGHITEEEVGSWHDQMLSTTTEWKFKPRFFKRKKTRTNQLQRLNNIIFLMCGNHVEDSLVKYAVFGKGIGPKIAFHYINLKACFIGSIIGPIRPYANKGFWDRGSFNWKWTQFLYKSRITSYPLMALKLILSGNFSDLSFRVKKILRRAYYAKKVKNKDMNSIEEWNILE